MKLATIASIIYPLLLMTSTGPVNEPNHRQAAKTFEIQQRFFPAVRELFTQMLQENQIISNLAGPRSRVSLNNSWKFLREDVKGAELPRYNDAGWSVVNLPHTWNAEDAFDEVPGYYRGAGWYRKTLEIDSNLKGKNLFLYFEAVNQVADVFVNGKLACHHEGGYSAFACEVTDLVNFGGEAGGNTIAIKADNSFNENIAPLSADFTFYGGIYRDVWLIATEPLHINVLDFASPGIYIDTPTVSEERATVRIRGTVVNSTAENKQVRVKNTITDARGKTVASLESSVNVPTNGKTTFEQLSESINNPQLWSTDNPYLYTVATNIYDGDSVVDIVENPLGFRWFSFDAEKGFFINGKPLKLQGTNRHQDYKGMGSAVSNEIHRSDLQMIKDMGANFLRLAHYPQDPVVLQTADQLGLIIWEEIPLVNYITPSQAFTETSKVMLTEMIRQHYNHPSVLMWGYMNEIFLKGPEKTPEYQQKTLELAQILEKLLRQEDPTRTSVMAMHRIPLYNEAGIADVPQVVGWNIYAGWYSGVFTDFGKFLDNQHEKFPSRPIIVSEYGADSDSRLHSLNPQRRDFTAEYQRRLHESYLQQIEARAFVAGSSLWNQFDFGVEDRGGSIPHLNQKGIQTFDRQPKDIYFFYQAKFSKNPVIYIATREWLQRSGSAQAAGKINIEESQNSQLPAKSSLSTVQPVEVYSNYPKVELFVNNQSLGMKEIDSSRQATWDVPFQNGINVIKACGFQNNSFSKEETCDRVEINFNEQPLNLADPLLPFKELAVNAGSDAQFIDDNGIIWEPDQEYQPGSWGYIAGEKTPPAEVENIRGTTADPLYQMMRTGTHRYRFDVPDGEYEIELLFAERLLKEANQRVFNVKINNQILLDNLDLFKQYGMFQAVNQTFKLKAVEGKGIEIQLIAGIGEPVMSGIRVRRLP
ncbi:glycoside hydrolase family 2 TIM barrel-domain containing protein [Microcoleus sp. FACHB-68]|uniref:glycoside hydrolase family 2 TIM barrel-domain containing protein n=1 Tax=Microcoleus sp. FACHB-68 TaxID=2692826 RepID=UPI00168240E2|nr:glycoside hydrolase family 2 TIM barrel-domain containing protein [Microcoleus sp. FACHB-68]MBD1937756.1 DUF4982 domain-containing protein [Microcoleus sp. FACHB-68]